MSYQRRFGNLESDAKGFYPDFMIDHLTLTKWSRSSGDLRVKVKFEVNNLLFCILTLNRVKQLVGYLSKHANYEPAI